MSRKSENQRKLLSQLDSMITLTGYGDMFDVDSLVMQFKNPMDYLIEIITKYISKEELIEKLADMLTKTLPAIELGVKGVILSNLKTQIDCNNDPRIPYKYRRRPEFSSKDDKVNNVFRGIPINLHNIDYKGILSVSPLSEYGQNYYFGTRSAYQISCSDEKLNGIEFRTYGQARQFVIDNNLKIDNIVNVSEIDNVHQLCRADDFNAFLWYVYHKTYYGEPITPRDETFPKEYVLYKPFQVSGVNTTVPYTVGMTVKSGQCIHMCYKVKITHSDYTNPSEEGPYNGYVLASEALMKNSNVQWEAYFVPLTSAEKSQEGDLIHGANWYINRRSFYDYLLPPNQRIPRDYNEEVPICNVEYIGTEQRFDKSLGVEEDTVLVSILPKPFIHVPHIEISKTTDENTDKTKISIDGEPIWRIKRILFDADGTPNPKGKYSVQTNGEGEYDKTTKSCKYSLKGGGNLIVNKDGSYSLDGLEDKSTPLYECYPGQTIYEFNYDFLMGVKLFDPVVVAKQIIEIVTNIGPTPPIGAFVNKSETEYQMRISQIVENIINQTTSESTDCFYNFSNSKFEELSRKAELKRSQGYSFNTNGNHISNVSTNHVLDILNEFKNDATLEENKSVITRAIKDVTTTISNEVLPEDKYSIEVDLIKNMLKALTNVIVETLISPKMVLLFEVNKKLMEPNESKPLSIEAFIESIIGLLTSIVSELADLVMRELLNWALSLLEKLLDKAKEIILNEQTMYYTALMIELLKACAFKPNRRQNLDSTLDEVYYADIDPIEKPIIESC